MKSSTVIETRPCAAVLLRDATIATLAGLVEANSPALRTKFKTGSLAVLDPDSMGKLLERAPLRVAAYHGLRILQRSLTVSTIDLSGNPEAGNLAKQACNPSFFPCVTTLRLRSVELGAGALASLFASLPPSLTCLDLSYAVLPSETDLTPLVENRRVWSSLKELSLAGTKTRIARSSFQVPPNITSLDLSDCDAVRLGPILESCTKLSCLRLAHSTVTLAPTAAEAAEQQRSCTAFRTDRSRKSRSITSQATSTPFGRQGTGRGGGFAGLADSDSDESPGTGGRTGSSASGSSAARWSSGDYGGSALSAMGPMAFGVLASAACSSTLRLLDLRGSSLTDAVQLITLASGLGSRLQVLDLRQSTVGPSLRGKEALRSLSPLQQLRGLALPNGMTHIMSLETVLRELTPLRRLKWLSVTVATLHMGLLPRERAIAAAAGAADPLTGRPTASLGHDLHSGADGDAVSSLSGPWCSLQMLDVAIACWSRIAYTGDALTSAERREAQETAAAGLLSMDDDDDDGYSVQDMGPVLAAMPQMRRLRVRGSGRAMSRAYSQARSRPSGKLVWARSLTQYARILSSGWSGVDEDKAGMASDRHSGGRSSLRRELGIAPLRSALARSPLEELCVEGVPAIHPRVLLLAACLPHLSHLRVVPGTGHGDGFGLAHALTADEAAAELRQFAAKRSSSVRAAGVTEAAAEAGGDQDHDESVKPASRRRRLAAGDSHSWFDDEVWTQLAQAIAPLVAVASSSILPGATGSKESLAAASSASASACSGSGQRAVEWLQASSLFTCPPSASLPKQGGLDSRGARAKRLQEFMAEAAGRLGTVDTDTALIAAGITRSISTATQESLGRGSGHGGAPATGAGPEADDDGSDDDEADVIVKADDGGTSQAEAAAATVSTDSSAAASTGLSLAAVHAMTEPSVSDLWTESDSDTDDDGEDGDRVETSRRAMGSRSRGFPSSGRAGAALPTVPDHEDDGEAGQTSLEAELADSDGSDSDDFGAFGRRAVASHQSRAKGRSAARATGTPKRHYDDKKKTTNTPISTGNSLMGGGLADQLVETRPLSPPVKLLGFPNLRQLTVKGTPELSHLFSEAIARVAPPCLRRVDCRGCDVGGADCSMIAGAISRRERQTFAQLVELAAAEANDYTGVAPARERESDAMLDDLSSVLPDAVHMLALGGSNSLAGIDSSVTVSTTAMHSVAPSEYDVEAGVRGQHDAESLVPEPVRTEREEASGFLAFRVATAAACPSVVPAVPIGEILVIAGSSAPAILGRAAVDTIENRGLMLGATFDRIVDWAWERVAKDAAAARE